MQLLEPEQYYQLIAFYTIACQAQQEVRNYEKALATILEDKSLVEKISDMIYNPATKGSKKEFDEILLSGGASIKWKPTQTKFAKEPKEENNVDW